LKINELRQYDFLPSLRIREVGLTLLLGADILTEPQKQHLAERFYELASHLVMQKKRTRSCPRAMRQPIQRWPKKKDQISSTDPVTISIVSPEEK
jgi:hypothetical protein